jgi:photosystem II stability/assembly factor-like uncharacterized protein
MKLQTLFVVVFVQFAVSCGGSSGQHGISLEQPNNNISITNKSAVDGLIRVGDSPAIDSPAVNIQCVSEQTCWVNTPSLVWRSLDGGKKWQEIYRPSQDDHIVACNFVTSNIGWLISSYKILMTQDGGLTWTEKPSPLKYPHGEARSLWFLDDGQTGWVAGGIYRAQTAEELSLGVPPNTKDATRKKVLQEAIYRTTDGGNSWQEQSLQSLVGRIMEVRFLNKSQGIALGERMVYQTTNGGEKWESAIFKKNCIRRTFFDENYEATPSNVFVSSAAGLLLGYNDGRVLKSQDSGRSWCDFIEPRQVQFESGTNEPEYFTDLYFETENRGWGLGWDRFLYQTKDGGRNWTKVTSEVRFESMSFWHNGNGILLSKAGIFRTVSELTN